MSNANLVDEIVNESSKLLFEHLKPRIFEQTKQMLVQFVDEMVEQMENQPNDNQEDEELGKLFTRQRAMHYAQFEKDLYKKKRVFHQSELKQWLEEHNIDSSYHLDAFRSYQYLIAKRSNRKISHLTHK